MSLNDTFDIFQRMLALQRVISISREKRHSIKKKSSHIPDIQSTQDRQFLLTQFAGYILGNAASEKTHFRCLRNVLLLRGDSDTMHIDAQPCRRNGIDVGQFAPFVLQHGQRAGAPQALTQYCSPREVTQIHLRDATSQKRGRWCREECVDSQRILKSHMTESAVHTPGHAIPNSVIDKGCTCAVTS